MANTTSHSRSLLIAVSPFLFKEVHASRQLTAIPPFHTTPSSRMRHALAGRRHSKETKLPQHPWFTTGVKGNQRERWNLTCITKDQERPTTARQQMVMKHPKRHHSPHLTSRLTPTALPTRQYSKNQKGNSKVSKRHPWFVQISFIPPITPSFLSPIPFLSSFPSLHAPSAFPSSLSTVLIAFPDSLSSQ